MIKIIHPRPSPIAATLYTLRDMNVDVIVMHGPTGCCFRTARLLEGDGVRVVTTGMSENDFILGAGEKLVEKLESKMGSHQDQSRVFDLLDMEKKINFFKQVISNCIKQNLSGLSAGSFMLGRFVAKPLPCRFGATLPQRK